MARCIKVFFLAAAIFALTQIGEALKCYHCVDNLGGNCDNPSKDFVQECGKELDEVCYFRNTSLLEGAGQIVRDCAPRNECETSRAKDVNTTCLTCETDLCNYNHSSSITPAISIIFCIVVFTSSFF